MKMKNEWQPKILSFAQKGSVCAYLHVCVWDFKKEAQWVYSDKMED